MFVSKMIRKGYMLTFFAYIRAKAQERLFSFLEYESGGLAASMFLGSRMDDNQSLYESAKVIGIFDIFSVSGMHVSMLWETCLLFFQKCTKSKPVIACVALLVLVAYFLLVGMQLPVIRAVAMRAVTTLAKLTLGRHLSPLYVLCALVLLYLIVYPQVLLKISFQYSYLVTGLVLLYAKSPLAHRNNYLFAQKLEVDSLFFQFLATTKMVIQSSGAAQVGVIPLSLFYFGYWNVFGMVVSPVLGLVASCVYLLTGIFLVAEALPLPELFGAVLGVFLYGVSTCFEYLTTALQVFQFTALKVQVSLVLACVLGCTLWLVQQALRRRKSVFEVI